MPSRPPPRRSGGRATPRAPRRSGARTHPRSRPSRETRARTPRPRRPRTATTGPRGRRGKPRGTVVERGRGIVTAAGAARGTIRPPHVDGPRRGLAPTSPQGARDPTSRHAGLARGTHDPGGEGIPSRRTSYAAVEPTSRLYLAHWAPSGGQARVRSTSADLFPKGVESERCSQRNLRGNIRKVRGAARLFARADLSRNASLRAKIRLYEPESLHVDFVTFGRGFPGGSLGASEQPQTPTRAVLRPCAPVPFVRAHRLRPRRRRAREKTERAARTMSLAHAPGATNVISSRLPPAQTGCDFRRLPVGDVPVRRARARPTRLAAGKQERIPAGTGAVRRVGNRRVVRGVRDRAAKKPPRPPTRIVRPRGLRPGDATRELPLPRRPWWSTPPPARATASARPGTPRPAGTR